MEKKVRDKHGGDAHKKANQFTSDEMIHTSTQKQKPIHSEKLRAKNADQIYE